MQITLLGSGENELFVVYGISFTFIEFAIESKAHQFSCSM